MNEKNETPKTDIVVEFGTKPTIQTKDLFLERIMNLLKVPILELNSICTFECATDNMVVFEMVYNRHKVVELTFFVRDCASFAKTETIDSLLNEVDYEKYIGINIYTDN